MAIVEGLDPKNIHDTGWGMLLPADLDASQEGAVLDALAPLINLRREQAGNAFRIFKGAEGVRPNETKNRFLSRFGAGPGPVNPNQMPYYLLIVASPGEIPYRFQTQLDVQYAVGRVWFDNPQRLNQYAESVVRAEIDRSARPAKFTFFSPQHPGDAFTQSVTGMIQALSARLNADLPAWQVLLLDGQQARISNLIETLEHDAPRVLFASGHSLVYPKGSEAQSPDQGGLVCANWPGPVGWSGPLPPSMCFRAADVPEAADLNGMVYIQYSSYSLGTPGNEDVPTHINDPEISFGVSQDIESAVHAMLRPASLARLPQRLLSLPGGRGALAAVGWIDQLWSYSHPDRAARELAVFETSLRKLADGYPLGAAFEHFQERYAEAALDLTSTVEEVSFGIVDDRLLADQWVGMTNARNLALFGDPAARLPSLETAKMEQQAIDLREVYPEVPGAAMEADESAIDLEISLAKLDAPGRYRLRMRLSGAAEAGQAATAEAAVELEPFFKLAAGSPQDYGARLCSLLFADRQTAMLFEEALRAQRAQPVSFEHEPTPLRLRLCIEPGAEELHNLAWETLWDQRANNFLLNRQAIRFQRYERPAGHSPLPPPRQHGGLRALAAISGPRPERGAPEVDTELERQHASQVMGNFQVDYLFSSDDRPGQVSVENLERALRKGYPVLYLVCQAVWKEALWLYLEGADGSPHVLRAEDLIQRLRHMRLERRPSLVVLRPPQGDLERETELVRPVGDLARLGPMLCAAGVDGVLVLPQGMPAAADQDYLHAFFGELAWDGRADRAAAVAREHLYPQPGWWGAALFTRRVDGRLWSGDTSPGDEPAQKQVELIIELSRRGVAEYEARLEFTSMGRDIVQKMSRPFGLDFDALRADSLDSQAYGARLFHNLFEDAGLRAFYQQALAAAQARGENLRLRLVIDPSAPELHQIGWERLFDAEQKGFLAMDEGLAFARYLFSSSWRAVELRPAARLRALTAVVNPKNLADYNLVSLDESAIQEIIVRLRQGMAVGELNRPVTLERLLKELSEPYDVFALVSHCILRDGMPYLFLQDDEGRVNVVDAKKFVSHLQNLARLPRLVVLGSNQSLPLATLLGEIGVPAVLAVLDNVSQATFGRFALAFVEELLDDGRVDRAAAVARSRVSDAPDWWAPVLYTRLRDGRLWYEGFSFQK